MAIYIKGAFTPLGNVKLKKDPDGTFMGAGLPGLIIDLEQDTGAITAITLFADDATLLAYLGDVAMMMPKDPLFEQELQNMYIKVQQLVQATKFLFGIHRLDEQTRMQATYFWSLDMRDWCPVPDRRKTKWLVAEEELQLPNALLNNISIMLKGGWKPFAAFDHLHKGFSDRNNTRFQWINGATAAEQGIKEFLVRLKPELEPLLTELSSPSVAKLYKTILVAYTGKASTYYKEIDKGAHIRNLLVHRTSEPAPGYGETIIYLQTIECALIELHLFLQPDDLFLQYLYETAKGRLQEVKTNLHSIYH